MPPAFKWMTEIKFGTQIIKLFTPDNFIDVDEVIEYSTSDNHLNTQFEQGG